MSADHRGGCACGAVGYAVVGSLRPVVDCHCERCRRITGHHMAATAATVDRVTVDGSVTWWEPTPGVFYGFCPVCGSTLFWHNDADPDHLSIAAGTLDPPTGLTTVKALFVAEHGDYHPPTAGIERHLGDG